MTEHKNDGFPERYKLFTPLESLMKFGHMICDQFRYSVPSEHHFEHPMDTPVEPVTHLPNEIV